MVRSGEGIKHLKKTFSSSTFLSTKISVSFKLKNNIVSLCRKNTLNSAEIFLILISHALI